MHPDVSHLLLRASYIMDSHIHGNVLGILNVCVRNFIMEEGDKPIKRLLPCLVKQILVIAPWLSCRHQWLFRFWRRSPKEFILARTSLRKPGLGSRLGFEIRFWLEARLGYRFSWFFWLCRLGFNRQQFVQVIFYAVKMLTK